jgi:vacuolar protein sorting-associated protein 54
MKKIEWDAKGGSTAVHPYMETLAKETGTLHRVLSKHLPDMTVSMIMVPVFNSYREQWTKAFEEADVQTEAGMKRLVPICHTRNTLDTNKGNSMQADVEHFRTKLSKIEGASEVSDKLLEVVKAKTIASEPESSEPAGEKQAQDNGSESPES